MGDFEDFEDVSLKDAINGDEEQQQQQQQQQQQIEEEISSEQQEANNDCMETHQDSYNQDFPSIIIKPNNNNNNPTSNCPSAAGNHSYAAALLEKKKNKLVEENLAAAPAAAPSTNRVRRVGAHQAAAADQMNKANKSVYISGLPKDVTVPQFISALRQFGPVKLDTINIVRGKNGADFAYAFVDFQSTLDASNAVAAKKIAFGQRHAYIAYKRT